MAKPAFSQIPKENEDKKEDVVMDMSLENEPMVREYVGRRSRTFIPNKYRAYAIGTTVFFMILLITLITLAASGTFSHSHHHHHPSTVPATSPQVHDPPAQNLPANPSNGSNNNNNNNYNNNNSNGTGNKVGIVPKGSNENKPYIEVVRVMSFNDKRQIVQSQQDHVFYDVVHNRRIDLFVDTSNGNQWEWFYVQPTDDNKSWIQKERVFPGKHY